MPQAAIFHYCVFCPYLKRDLSEPLFALYFKTLAKTLFKFLLEKKIKYFDDNALDKDVLLYIDYIFK